MYEKQQSYGAHDPFPKKEKNEKEKKEKISCFAVILCFCCPVLFFRIRFEVIFACSDAFLRLGWVIYPPKLRKCPRRAYFASCFQAVFLFSFCLCLFFCYFFYVLRNIEYICSRKV